MHYQDEPAKVLIVDDHASIRIGICGLIELERPRLCCVGAVGSAREALLRTRQLQPDVIVLDADLAGEDGIALIPALRGCAPCAIVVFTVLTDAQAFARARRLGAYACVNKMAPTALLIAAVLAAALAGSQPHEIS